MKRVVLLTSHHLESDRKAGFHWLAEAFWRAGWHVTFFTESISWLSRLRRGQSRQASVFQHSHRLRQVRERMSSFVWLTPFHPVNLRSKLLNRLCAPLLDRYRSLPLGESAVEIARADLFVFDSDHGLLLFDRLKRMNPRARFVYRVSDNIAMMNHHPLLPAQEERVLPRFDLVSVPSHFFRERFPHAPNVSLHYHGIEKPLFDRPAVNPYRNAGPHVVFAGKHYFDEDFVRKAHSLFPGWKFHIFGAAAELPSAANVIRYGERPFAELVPYLQHADIGLQTLSYRAGAECFSDSLKMHQYTYCRLPIVAPRFLTSDRPHVFYYEPGDVHSIRAALDAAVGYDRTQISAVDIHSWDEIVTKLVA